MTGRQRMDRAMRLGEPDRVPIMCQLALGHYFLNTGLDEIDIWHSTEGFGEALLALQRRYGFDGILINLPGRDPNWRSYIRRIEEKDGEKIVHWVNGLYTVAPPDDNPHVYLETGDRYAPAFEEVDPDALFYMEPHDLSGITYPYSWGFSGESAPRGDHFFPPWHYDLIRYVLSRAGGDVSVHAEIFSVLAVHGDAGLRRRPDGADGRRGEVQGVPRRAQRGCHRAGPRPGRGRRSRRPHLLGLRRRRPHLPRPFREFVLPYERKVIAGIKARYDLPVYTHTCGAIGDRLDLMMDTGTDGIDTLDPPPLGTVELPDAKRMLSGRCFIKGNVDPVNTILQGTPDAVLAEARRRIGIAGPGGGYVLSSACSVPPHAPPENILKLREAAERFGRYPIAASAS